METLPNATRARCSPGTLKNIVPSEPYWTVKTHEPMSYRKRWWIHTNNDATQSNKPRVNNHRSPPKASHLIFCQKRRLQMKKTLTRVKGTTFPLMKELPTIHLSAGNQQNEGLVKQHGLKVTEMDKWNMIPWLRPKRRVSRPEGKKHKTNYKMATTKNVNAESKQKWLCQSQIRCNHIWLKMAINKTAR